MTERKGAGKCRCRPLRTSCCCHTARGAELRQLEIPFEAAQGSLAALTRITQPGARSGGAGSSVSPVLPSLPPPGPSEPLDDMFQVSPRRRRDVISPARVGSRLSALCGEARAAPLPTARRVRGGGRAGAALLRARRCGRRCSPESGAPPPGGAGAGQRRAPLCTGRAPESLRRAGVAPQVAGPPGTARGAGRGAGHTCAVAWPAGCARGLRGCEGRARSSGRSCEATWGVWVGPAEHRLCAAFLEGTLLFEGVKKWPFVPLGTCRSWANACMRLSVSEVQVMHLIMMHVCAHSCCSFSKCVIMCDMTHRMTHLLSG